jgi:nitrate/TMAO reductase-like tetraheme cytochrome c subunit
VPLKCNPSVDFFLNCQTKHGQRCNCKHSDRSNPILQVKQKIKAKAKTSVRTASLQCVVPARFGSEVSNRRF